MNKSLLLCILALTPLAFADPQPMHHPNTLTIMGFSMVYDQLAGQDPDAYRALYHLDADDDSQRLATAMSHLDAEAGILQQMLVKKWGSAGEEQVIHALGFKTLQDMREATLHQNQSHAMVLFADGTPGPHLIRTSDGWRLDIAAIRQSIGIPLDDYIHQMRAITRFLPDFADEIANGKFHSPAAACAEINRRIAKLSD